MDRGFNKRKIKPSANLELIKLYETNFNRDSSSDSDFRIEDYSGSSSDRSSFFSTDGLFNILDFQESK